MSRTQQPRNLFQRHNDQLPFIRQSRFSALPNFIPNLRNSDEFDFCNTVVYIINIFGVFPLISLPSVLVKCGLYAILIMAVIGGLQVLSAGILGKCWIIAEKIRPELTSHIQRNPYVTLGDMTYGFYFGAIIGFFQNLSIFLSSIPSILVAAICLQIFVERISGETVNISFCFWILILCIAMYPLVCIDSLRRKRLLIDVSLTITIVTVILLFYVVIASNFFTTQTTAIFTTAPSTLNIVTVYSVLLFQFNLHPTLLTIQSAMRNKAQIGSASCQAFMGIITLIFTYIVGYKFGIRLPSNLLEVLPASLVLYITLLLISIQMCFSNVTSTSALFHNFEKYFDILKEEKLKKYFLRLVILFLILIISEFVPNFDDFILIVGGTITSPLVFIFPPILLVKFKKMEVRYENAALHSQYGSIPLDLNFKQSNETNEEQITRCGRLKGWFFRHFEKLQNSSSLLPSMAIFGAIGFIWTTYLNLFEVRVMLLNTSAFCFRLSWF